MAVYVTDPFRRNVVTVLVVLALVLIGLIGVAAMAAVWNFLNPEDGEAASWAITIAWLLSVDFASLFAFVIPLAAATVPVAINAVSYRFVVRQTGKAGGGAVVTQSSELSRPGKAIALILLIGGLLNLVAILVLNHYRGVVSIVILEGQVESIATLLMVSLSFQAAYFVQLMGLRPEG